MVQYISADMFQAVACFVQEAYSFVLLYSASVCFDTRYFL